MRQQKIKNPAESHKRRRDSLFQLGRMIQFFSLLLCTTLNVFSAESCVVLKGNHLLSVAQYPVNNMIDIKANGIINGNSSKPKQLSYPIKDHLFFVIGEELLFPNNFSSYHKTFFTSLVVNRLDGGCLHAIVCPNSQICSADFMPSTTVDWLNCYSTSKEEFSGIGNERGLKKHLVYTNNDVLINYSGFNLTVLTTQDGSIKETIPFLPVSVVSKIFFSSAEINFNQSIS